LLIFLYDESEGKKKVFRVDTRLYDQNAWQHWSAQKLWDSRKRKDGTPNKCIFIIYNLLSYAISSFSTTSEIIIKINTTKKV